MDSSGAESRLFCRLVHQARGVSRLEWDGHSHKQFLSSRYPLQLVPTMMNNKDFSIGRTDVKFTIHLGTGYNGSRRVLQSTLRNVLEGIQKGMRPLVLAALTVCFLFFFFFFFARFLTTVQKIRITTCTAIRPVPSALSCRSSTGRCRSPRGAFSSASA